MNKNVNNQPASKTARRQGWKVFALTASCVALLGGVSANVIHAAPSAMHTISAETHKTSTSKEAKVAYKTIKTVAGETFTINREELGSNGYSWTYTTDKGITFVSKSEKSPKGENGMVKPTIKTWNFKADKPGTYKITFKYVTAWKKDAKPAETVIYTIKVGDKKQSEQANVTHKKIEATAGKTFDIKLEQNDSTGYTWNYKAEPQLKLVKASEQATASSSKSKDGDTIVGAPTNKTWVFQADKPGTYKLTFKYTPAWEKGAKPAKTVIYTVHVK
ncbi:protease inhibitor I42 family protein [Paenibacillus campi]|uniref:protease inhibitor I42 family protein n=1 Tax=Paenibacillus campi TaxID=3106031 RepID=UPI002AFF8D0C|nr:protease inhibitor I42 family protein [Paenibacillus sp. SGZ-1009]